MMDIILKQMGINPDEIKNGMKNAVENFEKTVKHFDDRLNRLEAKIDALQPKEAVNETLTE